MTSLVKHLDLQHITPFYQDWGGLIGLRVATNEPDRFDRIVIGNTGLPDASGLQGLLGNYFFQRRVKKVGKIDEARKLTDSLKRFIEKHDEEETTLINQEPGFVNYNSIQTYEEEYNRQNVPEEKEESVFSMFREEEPKESKKEKPEFYY